MPVTLIIALLTTFGPSAVTLIDTLITKWQTGGSVTAAEWATLSSALKQTASDRMTLALSSAGIDANSPQGQALLQYTK